MTCETSSPRTTSIRSSFTCGHRVPNAGGTSTVAGGPTRAQLWGSDWARWRCGSRADITPIPVATSLPSWPASLGWSTVPYGAAISAFRQRRRALATYRVDKALEDLCKATPPLPLAKLFQLNRRQLDQYQEMTKRQEGVAFKLTWGAAVFGFGVLIAGIVLSYRVDTGTSRYVVGGLSGLGTLLSGYLGKTFLDSHTQAMEQMNRYYREPLLTGRLLAAERIADQSRNESSSAYAKDIIDRLVSHHDIPSQATGADAAAPKESIDLTEQAGGSPVDTATIPSQASGKNHRGSHER
jgi:hypothetical protein